MRYGFYLPTRGPQANPGALARLLAHAEDLDFNSVMIADHLVFPISIDSKYPYTVDGAFPGQGDAMDLFSLMAFVAGQTKSLRLVSSVMIVPQRNPIATAKALATIDVLSGGRVIVGCGVGWLKEEFEALDAPDFHSRGRVTNEFLKIFKTLWTTDPASYEGEFYSFRDLHCLPHPVQSPHPPIWIGGHSKAAMRRVAALGDGWHPVGANPAVPLGVDELTQRLDELQAMTEAQDRDFDEITIAYKAPLYDIALQSTSSGANRRPFCGTDEEIAEDIRTYESVGVHELIFDFRATSLEDSLERMSRFSSIMKMTR